MGELRGRAPGVRVERVAQHETGKAYGAEIMKVAPEGTISEVSYKFPRPGPDKTPCRRWPT
jgi:hypothetical protein